MPGKINAAIKEIIDSRAHGNPTIAVTTKTKLMLKGVNPDLYSEMSPDDPLVLEKLQKIAADLGITLIKH